MTSPNDVIAQLENEVRMLEHPAVTEQGIAHRILLREAASLIRMARMVPPVRRGRQARRGRPARKAPQAPQAATTKATAPRGA